MGLDGVELIMAVEAEFGLSIPDHDAGQMTTVGDLFRYVVQRAGLPLPPEPESIRPTEDPVPPDILRAVGLPANFHLPTAMRVAQSLAARHYAERVPEFYGLSWQRLTKIVSEQLGVEPCYVTFEARFVEDLGMD